MRDDRNVCGCLGPRAAVPRPSSIMHWNVISRDDGGCHFALDPLSMEP